MHACLVVCTCAAILNFEQIYLLIKLISAVVLVVVALLFVHSFRFQYIVVLEIMRIHSTPI